jgi:predicted enzyme related to lactoylglutathione lyase
MPNNLAFFAIHADDVARARKFYEKVFQWKFDAWGPPGFFTINTGTETDVCGALQQRHDIVPGEKINGLECTFAVKDIDATAKAIVANGGTIIMPKCEIPTVGWLIKIKDPEGNILCIKQPATGHGG